MKPSGSDSAPRGGLLDPRIALPAGLMVAAFGCFLLFGARAGSGGQALALAVVALGAAYAGGGLVRWRAMRRAGQRPGQDPPLPGSGAP